jgi:Secretion system C-terminal sorting domain/Leucine Rich Repeat
MKTYSFLFIMTIAFSLPQKMYSQVSEQDSLALIAFYNSTNGDEWIDNTGWRDGPVIDWFGITLTGSRVTTISLEGNNLSGSLPDSIGDLTGLGVINISINEISGEIPTSIGNWEELYHLELSNNKLSGTFPMELASCTKLNTVSAINNQFSGGFPEVLLKIPSLKVLRIGGNPFGGEIPSAIDTLFNLEGLIIGASQFSGTMPSLTHLTKLVALTVSANELEGDMSDILGFHPDMRSFNCYNNKFTGCVSEEHFSASTLKTLQTYVNDFSCIGDFSAFIDTGILTRIWCSNNRIPFEYLEKNVDVESYAYRPQDSMLQSESHVLADGDTLVIDAGTRGINTSYTWYKDDQVIPDETASTLEINGFREDDAGVYYMRATNTLLPDLTLYRYKVNVKSNPVSATRDIIPKELSIYPNPVSDQIFIKDMTGDGVVKILDINGKLVFDQELNLASLIPVGHLVTGLYVVVIILNGNSYRTKIVKL